MSDKKEKLILVGECEDHLHMLSEEGPVTLSPLQEGKPISGKAISLTPTDNPYIFDSDNLIDPDSTGKIEVEDRDTSSPGPAKYNSAAFLQGWDETFGGN